jgi:CheY-like chemotaxis protein
MQSASASATAIAVVDDLIFQTKISATSRALGIELHTARDVAGLLQLLDRHAAPLVMVDLNLPDRAGSEAIAAAAAHARHPRIIAFVSHVQADLAQAGLAAGAHDVMPRSRFSLQLAELLQAHCRTSTEPGRTDG